MQRAPDLFAGPGGWDVYDAELGLVSDGVENDPAARATRQAAGLRTVHDDVRTFQLPPDHPYDGLKASPPCQTYSAAGNGHGRQSLDQVLEELENLRWYPAKEIAYWRFTDVRTGLVLEPFRLILQARAQGRPFQWIALEQVPAVLPVWQAYAGYLRELGYSVAVGNVHAEQYGVPQTRKRAVLLASLDRDVSLPEPTHSRFHSRSPERLDPGVKPWVSMAEALGYGLAGRPSPTVTGGGTYTGGAEPFSHLSRWTERTDWVQRSNYSKGTSDGSTAEERGRTLRTADQPSTTVTSKGFQWQDGRVYRNGNQTHSAKRPPEHPAPTVHFSARSNKVEWIDAEQAPDPAASGERVTVQEAAVLQTFPLDYPWRGNKSQQFQQVGNAIPPLLAKVLLEQVV